MDIRQQKPNICDGRAFWMLVGLGYELETMLNGSRRRLRHFSARLLDTMLRLF